MVDSLYKFFPNNAHDHDALANNYLWFSHYSNFNDPFEDVFIKNAIVNKQSEFDMIRAIEFYKLIHKGEIAAHVIEQIIMDMMLNGTFETEYRNVMSKTYTSAKKSFQEFVDSSKACCFARDSHFGKAINNRLMWSHYADGLRGFCVEFDRKELINGIAKSIGKEVGLSSIRYGKLQKFSFEELAIKTAKNITLEDDMFGIGSIVSFKSEEWAYESEFRLVTDVANEISIPPESIKSVTVGSKMTRAKLTTLKTILEGNQNIKCDLYESFIDLDTFELERKVIFEIGK